MKKIGFSAMRRIVGATIPGSELVMDGVSVAVSRAQGDEDESTSPFKNRDADQHGARRYGVSQSRDNDEVVDAQVLLAKLGHLEFSDIDGCIGPGTLRAIESWESQNGVNFYTGEPPPDMEPDAPGTQLVAGGGYMPDWKQFGDLGKEHLGADKSKDTFSRSGCATCAIGNTLGSHGYQIAPVPLSQEIDASGGYDARSRLQWGGVLEALHRLTGAPWAYDKRDGTIDNIRLALDHAPVTILEVRTERGPHFVTAHEVLENDDVVISDPGKGNHHPGADRLLGPPGNYALESVRILRPV